MLYLWLVHGLISVRLAWESRDETGVLACQHWRLQTFVDINGDLTVLLCDNVLTGKTPQYVEIILVLLRTEASHMYSICSILLIILAV